MEEMTNEEPRDLQLEHQQTAAEEIASEQKIEENVSSMNKSICLKWSEVQSFVEKYRPNKVGASRVMKVFNNNDLSNLKFYSEGGLRSSP